MIGDDYVNCDEVIKLIEEYVMEELDTNTHLMVEEHLRKCSSCSMEYHEKKQLIKGLQEIKKSIKIKEDVLDMAKKNAVNNINSRGNIFRKSFSTIVAGVFFVLFLLSSSIIVFPTFAIAYVPELPIVKQVKEVQEIKKENEKLKMAIKDINGTQIKEIKTSEGIETNENDVIQKMAINFIKAQYKEEIKTALEMCTEEFKKELEKNNGFILKGKKGDIIFSTITNTSKEGDVYVVCIRVSDDLDDSEYQWDFEFKKVGEKFLVSSVGLNA
jgi:hypothetical protein